VSGVKLFELKLDIIGLEHFTRLDIKVTMELVASFIIFGLVLNECPEA
jgi:hypothetical protein